ncbi:MAG: methyltransferase domain-containing protein [Pseudomonadota bacterium]
MTTERTPTISEFYDAHPINEDEILSKLTAAGVDPERATALHLSEFDQDHYGGAEAVDRLADAAGINPAQHVLDVCSGMGGPARWLAYHRGCRVTGLDVTQSRVESARRLTDRVGLSHVVDFQLGDATEMPFAPESFDALISQEAFLHIADKTALVRECARVMKVGGMLAFTDVVMRTQLQSITLERLERDIHTANLATDELYGALLTVNGCTVVQQDDLSAEWADLLSARLEMYRSLRDTTVAKFGTAHFEHYDRAYEHYASCFSTGLLGGIRVVARKSG